MGACTNPPSSVNTGSFAKLSAYEVDFFRAFSSHAPLDRIQHGINHIHSPDECSQALSNCCSQYDDSMRLISDITIVNSAAENLEGCSQSAPLTPICETPLNLSCTDHTEFSRECGPTNEIPELRSDTEGCSSHSSPRTCIDRGLHCSVEAENTMPNNDRNGSQYPLSRERPRLIETHAPGWSSLDSTLLENNSLARNNARCGSTPSSTPNTLNREYQCSLRSVGSIMETLTHSKCRSGSLNECSICLEPYAEGDIQMWLPCTHTSHQYCLGKWIKKSKPFLSTKCPVCGLSLSQMFEMSMRAFNHIRNGPEKRLNQHRIVNPRSQSLIADVPTSQTTRNVPSQRSQRQYQASQTVQASNHLHCVPVLRTALRAAVRRERCMASCENWERENRSM